MPEEQLNEPTEPTQLQIDRQRIDKLESALLSLIVDIEINTLVGDIKWDHPSVERARVLLREP